VLPAGHRLTRRHDFASTVRRGRRGGRSRVVVHLLTTPDASPDVPARGGLVVSRAAGNSVVRHRVARRLRHLLAARLDDLPAGSRLVVRALPPAATASSAELGSDLDAALRTALRREARR
jgi:ribonuclease P protein component